MASAMWSSATAVYDNAWAVWIKACAFDGEDAFKTLTIFPKASIFCWWCLSFISIFFLNVEHVFRMHHMWNFFAFYSLNVVRAGAAPGGNSNLTTGRGIFATPSTAEGLIRPAMSASSRLRPQIFACPLPFSKVPFSVWRV